MLWMVVQVNNSSRIDWNVLAQSQWSRKPNFSGPSNNTNEELAIRGVFVEMCDGAVRKLAKGNILSVPNLANVFHEVLNIGSHKSIFSKTIYFKKKDLTPTTLRPLKTFIIDDATPWNIIILNE